MKLAVVIVLFTVFQVSAHPLSGQIVSVTMKNAEIKKVLKNIEQDGNVRFLFNADLKDLKKKVDINASNLPLNDVLSSLFTGTSLTFKTLDNNLVVVLSTDAGENQSIRVTGKVTGEKGEALGGVSVQEKGTKAGTSTDNFGNYSLTVDNNATLIFSSIGYETKEVAVNNRSVVDVQLNMAIKKSDEVVVIGYGSASKRDLTGSVAKVKGEALALQPNTNPLASLQSKVAGLNIINDATPGSAPDVRIRGTISLGTVKPVYIIDGIFSDNMDFVNPNEIESVEILKDPSSLAVFGIRGAAGAILVTTKKAKAGQINVNFNSTVGTKKLVDKIKLANGDQFRSLLSAEANNRVFDDPSNNSLLNFVNNVGGPGMNAFTGNTDWIDAVTRTATFSTTNASLDASTDKNRFHVGLGYVYDEGLVKHVRYDRMSVNLNDEVKVSSKLKLGFNLIFSKESLPYNSSALENARRALPIISADPKSYYMRNPYGVDSGYYNLYSTTPIIQNSETNPLATLEYNWNKKIDTRYRYVGSFFVDLNITKDLNFRSTWYADMGYRENREYTPLYNLYDPTKSGQPGEVFAKNPLTAVLQEKYVTRRFQQDYIATYKKKFGDHSLTATAGFTTYYNYYDPEQLTLSQKTPGVNIIPVDKR
ncbi:MAG TPA: SusC/RagA family TonB-linked outer membrane protein, partial [Ferruginibacter sp.]|nr:SusC/RagA family TonB-linked outer membrane protein [Ferruginibacter sp.]